MNKNNIDDSNLHFNTLTKLKSNCSNYTKTVHCCSFNWSFHIRASHYKAKIRRIFTKLHFRLQEDVPLSIRIFKTIKLLRILHIIWRECLNEHFAEEWSDLGGPIYWPPRTPAPTTLDYYLWNCRTWGLYIKSKYTRWTDR